MVWLLAAFSAAAIYFVVPLIRASARTLRTGESFVLTGWQAAAFPTKARLGRLGAAVVLGVAAAVVVAPTYATLRYAGVIGDAEAERACERAQWDARDAWYEHARILQHGSPARRSEAAAVRATLRPAIARAAAAAVADDGSAAYRAARDASTRSDRTCRHVDPAWVERWSDEEQ